VGQVRVAAAVAAALHEAQVRGIVDRAGELANRVREAARIIRHLHALGNLTFRQALEVNHGCSPSTCCHSKLAREPSHQSSRDTAGPYQTGCASLPLAMSVSLILNVAVSMAKGLL